MKDILLRFRPVLGRAYLLVFVCVFCTFSDAAEAGSCSSEERLHLVIETVEGNISIELLSEAAPNAVATLVRLVEGPIFHPELTGNELRGDSMGYYDGLEFDKASSGSFLTTSVRYPVDAIVIESEIDANALGLSERVIKDFPEAMEVWQREILPYQRGIGREEDLHPVLAEWLKQWAETHQPNFLIAVSQKTINEVLGYHYQEGLLSQPVVRGAVTLEVLTPRWSSPRMTINLRNRPDHDGRRMVVGHVVSGLDLAEQLATRKLTPSKMARKRPLVPVRINKALLECRDPGDFKHEQKGGK